MLTHQSSDRPGFRVVRLALPRDHAAGRISVVGNFNDWTPGLDELLPVSETEQAVSIELPETYRAVFRYLGEFGWWFDEPDADLVDAEGSIVLSLVDEPAPEPTSAEPWPRPYPGVGGAPASEKKLLSPAELAAKREAKLRRKAEKAARKLERSRVRAQERHERTGDA